MRLASAGSETKFSSKAAFMGSSPAVQDGPGELLQLGELRFVDRAADVHNHDDVLLTIRGAVVRRSVRADLHVAGLDLGTLLRVSAGAVAAPNGLLYDILLPPLG